MKLPQWTCLAAGVAIAGACALPPANAGSVSVTVDAAKVLQTGVRGGARLGINTDYWWDHQANRAAGAVPFATAAAQMGKFWRYPGGEKSDGYLWSVAPFAAPNPKLARTGSGDWPANDASYWDGGSSTTGAFTHPVYDFDQFMADCQAAGCTPVIVVAYDGVYKPPQGGDSLTWQQALDTSAAWVKYANVVKGYNVRYWEIGNETYKPGYMGGDPGRAQQAQDFIAMCANMKAQDPTILCGINTDSQADWSTLLSIAHSSIDFLDVHSYEAWSFADYTSYAASGINPNTKVDAAWTPLQNYPQDKDRIKIVVGETGGITFGIRGAWTQADAGHALMTFENMARLQQDNRVAGSMFWTSRWVEQNKSGNMWPSYPSSEYDALKPDNSPSPQGWGIKLLRDYSLDNMVSAASGAMVGAYATTGGAGLMNIWLVNRSTSPTTVSVKLRNYASPGSGAVSVYKGTGSSDMYPVFAKNQSTVPVKLGTMTLTLDPVSITVIQLDPGVPSPVSGAR